ncbi:MFS transporter, partial [Escherichia marmotae]|nr:MFS transporter [Escherichia marmotae]
HVELTAVEQAYLNAGSVNARRDPLSFAEWRSLFRNRTMWGMMLGFSGINYTAWLYLAWLPGYLQTAYNLDLKSTGLMAAIPFLFGAAGMLVNGYVTDWLVKGGMAPIKSRKICIIAGMFCSAAFTLVVPQATASVGSIQNFASFICASFAPIITGFIVDTTHSFRLALIICGCVTAAGALAYIFLVRQPINDPRKD